MKRTRINPEKPAPQPVPVEELKPQPDPPMERHAHTVTFRIAGRCYEMTWYSEVREITKGPAKIIEMPVVQRTSAEKRDSAVGAPESGHRNATGNS